ncbi:MAG: hypothetical protein VX730_07500 [Pseudomonadota bacterium]|nr:hypothetical protein [Pseudomonadota bacterium]
MGDNCDPNNCSRCDRYAERIAAFKQDIKDAPHFNANETRDMLALFDLMNQDKQRSVVRGYALFQKFKDDQTLSSEVRQKLKASKDYQAFVSFYKAAR